MSEIKNNRIFMKCPSFGEIMKKSDQQNGVQHPTYERERTGKFIELPTFEDVVTCSSYLNLLDQRRSERVYSDMAMTREQLAFLLWSSGGIQQYRGKNRMSTFRPVPSGGARHPFELYIAVKNVEGLEPGLYRYAPTKNVGEKRVTIERLAPLFDDYETKMNDLLAGQKWATKAPIVIFVSCIPYRAEWRYNDAAHRVMLMDLGHIGQNLMLSATALGLGSCCMAAFDQKLCDEVFSFDGDDEFTIYVLSVGSPKVKNK
jgi:SagB-type dehydrogenase family enzyme